MNCEMCGKQEASHKAIIEGIELTVCSGCAKYGKILRKPQFFAKKKEVKKTEKEKEPEIIEKIISDYGQKIKKARTQKEMTQEEFARKLNIKESLLHKIENSLFEPSIPLARKLEKMLGIKLVEQTTEQEKVEIKKGKTEGMTVGDLIKLK